MRVPIARTQAKVAFAQMTSAFPAEWGNGLPAGGYTLRAENGLESVTFVIEDGPQRRRVMKTLDDFASLTGGRSDPLWIQVAVEHLLSGGTAKAGTAPT